MRAMERHTPMKTFKTLMSAVAVLAVAVAGSAQAAGTALDTQSARAVGMAGSVVGFVDDASAIYFNPAGIAQGQGIDFMVGITGIVDGGGVSMYPANYEAVFKLWHDKQLTLRVAYHLCAPKPGSELDDLRTLTQLSPQGFGDAMLHFNGPGEILIWADWTDGDITPDGKAKLAELLRWAASRGYTIQLHWNPDRTVHDLLDVVEDISRDYPVRELRWTVLHLYDVSEDSLKRMKSLGLIWGVQDGLYFGGERLQKEVGTEAAKQMPRIATAMRLGLTVAGGTDAHRVSSYNPFVSLQWYLDGTTIGGVQTRGADEAPSRRQALEMYTRNSAFMANDDDKRGTLEVGKFADLAVLSADYLTTPVKEIGKIRSVLTMVGGEAVYADTPFADIAAGRQ